MHSELGAINGIEPEWPATNATLIGLRMDIQRCLELEIAQTRHVFYFFFGDSMTPSAMHSHLPLRSIQVSIQT